MRAVGSNPVSGLLRQEAYVPDRKVLVYGEDSWTYTDLVQETGCLAASPDRGWISPGALMAYVGLNSVTFIETMLTDWWAGTVFEPLNFRLGCRLSSLAT